jgi:hypothetical protein
LSKEKFKVVEAQMRHNNQALAANAQQQAITWLESRGVTREMADYYKIGFEEWKFAPDQSRPHIKESYGAIAIHIPAGEEGQYYRKLRIAPWLTGENRPVSLPTWSQYGVPSTLFFTHHPSDAEATWFCEGEWDAIRLGWLARQLHSRTAICCSTAGCNTVPKQEQLDQLPGNVVIFFDRNDQPTKNGLIPGEEGAKKLARALGDRARIAKVPMSNGCEIKGWDVSNALDAGYSWADFEAAATAALKLSQIENQQPEVTLRELLLEIFDQSYSAFDRKLALLNLAREKCYSLREIENLAKALELEQTAEFDQAEAVQKLSDLLQTQQTSLDLTRYLEPWFANLLLKTADAMPTAPEFLFTTLLPAAASRIGSAAQVVVKASAKYVQPMIIQSLIASGSGTLKSPTQQVVISPLYNLEKEAYESYIAELADYQSEETRGSRQDNAQEKVKKPPTRKRFVFSDATIETLQRIHAENPRGLLGYCDELAGAFKMRNAYRRGLGGDEEAELSQWNGSAVIVDRAEKSVCLPKTAISRTGSIQGEVLADLMGDHQDANGAWSRWLVCAADAPPRYLNLLEDEQEDTGISEALTTLYVELGKIPQQDYFLSLEAKRLFQPWQHQLVDAQRAEDNTGLKLVYPKIEAYTARLALWLHIVNAVLRHENPTQIIDGETMERAIELAAYYLWQHRLIHTHNAPDSGLAALTLKIQKFAQPLGQVTASRLKSGIRALRKTPVNEIRQLMQTLAQAGYGQVEGEGTEMLYIPFTRDRRTPPKTLSNLPESAIDVLDTQLTEVPTQTMQAVQVLQSEADGIDAVPAANQLLDNGGVRDAVPAALNDCSACTNELPQNSDVTDSEKDQPELRPLKKKTNPNHFSDSSSIVRVGDVCQYVGAALKQLKGLDRLVVETLNGTNAVVRAPHWYISHEVPLSDLIKRAVKEPFTPSEQG